MSTHSHDLLDRQERAVHEGLLGSRLLTRLDQEANRYHEEMLAAMRALSAARDGPDETSAQREYDRADGAARAAHEMFRAATKVLG